MRSLKEIIKRIFYFSPLLIVFFFTWCEEEKRVAREYPRLTATSVINISDSGATFTADLYSMGTEAAKEYGFLWDVYGELDYNSSNKVILGKPEKPGVFSADISSALMKDREYNVRPFVKTEDRTIYGPVSTFKSLGSKAPVIYGIYPDSTIWFDTIMIKGKYFSWIAGQNIVKLNGVECQVCLSTDTTLYITISNKFTQKLYLVSVELAGRATPASKTIKLLLPELKDISKNDFFWRDTVIVTGKNFTNPHMYYNTLSATIGGAACNPVRITRDTLWILVGDNVSGIENELLIVANGIDLKYAGKLKLSSPIISSASPKEGTWNNAISIRGKFHPLSTKNIFRVGTEVAVIKSFTRDSVKIIVPPLVNGSVNSITLIATPFNVSCPDSFKLYPPVIHTFSPTSGPTGVVIRITGRFLNNNSSSGFTKVWLGNIQCSVITANDSVVTCNIPSGTPAGPVKIKVQAGTQSSISSGDFNVTNPRITNVYPLSGTFDDEVTIEGENLTYLNYPILVYFGSHRRTPLSSSANKIIVKVPLDLDSIPCILKVDNTNSWATSSQTFLLDPPEITSVSPSVLAPGQSVVISGKNFNPSIYGAQAWWGSYPLSITSANPTEIIATIPLYLNRGYNKIGVKIGGYKRDYPTSFYIKSNWGEISLPATVKWNSGINYNEMGTSFSLNGLGYMMDYYDAKMISYNPLTSEFKELGVHSVFKGQSGLTSVINQDSIFLMGGGLGLFRYDDKANAWIYVSSLPTNTRNGISFSLNGKIYFGLTYNFSTYTLGKEFWVYDVNSKSWSSKSNFPGFSTGFAIASFVIKNKGYVLFSNGKFGKYDPDTDTWTQLANYPDNQSHGLVSFVINEIGYVGLGRCMGCFGDNFWKYDPISNTWVLCTQLPKRTRGGRINSVSFVIKNIAYVGFGYKAFDTYGDNYIQQNDFYEFDPNYPLK